MYSQQGIVSQVSSKAFTDKWGKALTLWSFQLQGDNRWYRTGTEVPQFAQGQQISFVFEQAGNNSKVQPNSVQVVGGAPAAPAAAPPPPPPAAPQRANTGAPRKAAAGAKDDYWANKEAYDKEITQPRIAYSAAQKVAVEIVGLALQHDMLSLGTKKADKLELVLNYVDEITGRLALKNQHAHEILAELAQSQTADALSVLPNAPDNEDDMYGDD